MLLAGDIGGTKVDLGIFSPDRGPRAPLARAEFPSGEFPALTPIVERFLAQTGIPVDRACFAVAGPVLGGTATITNLPWVLEASRLAAELGVRSVRLMNDLEAVTTGAVGLEDADVLVINRGEPTPRGPIAVIAPGTGLGQGFAIWTGDRYQACPSEGGHADFAPADRLQEDLLRFMRQRKAHVSVERVCSGIGVPNLYAFLAEGRVAESPAMAAALAASGDRTRTILEAGMVDPPDPLCAAVVQLFVSILGAEAGNLAFKTLATGGVFLGGGLSIHLRAAIARGPFLRYFTAKGRLSPILERIPVKLILAPAALIGAATAGLAGDPSTTRGT